MRLYRSILSLAALCLVPIGMAEAGAVFVLETTYADQPGKIESYRMSADGPNLMIEMPADQAGDGPEQMIFLGERAELLVINHTDKTYMIVDKATMKAMTDMMGGAEGGGGEMEAMLQEALKDVPEADRAEIEKMMREQMGAGMPKGDAKAPKKGPSVEYRKTKERAEQEGYKTVKYEEVRDGVVISEMWVTDWGNIAGGNETRDAFKSMAKFWAETFGGTAAMSEENPMEVFDEIDGFPIVDRDIENGKPTTQTILKSAKKVDVDPSVFKPPAGYTLSKMGE